MTQLSTVEEITEALRLYHTDMLYVVQNILYYEYKITTREQVTIAILKSILLDYAREHAEEGDIDFANHVRAIAERII